MTIRDKIVEFAKAEVGTIEKPLNRVKYNEWYGNGLENGGKDAAWCATFVSYIYNWAGCPIGKINHEEGFSYVPTLYYQAKAKGWLTLEPKTADVVIFDWKADNKIDHTGIFVAWVDHTRREFWSVEGNTSPDEKGDQSNGGQVCLKKRTYNPRVTYFVNLIDRK